MVSAAALQGAFSAGGVNLSSTIGATRFRRRGTNEENTMLRTFTAALIATALVAGPALAAQPSSNAGAAPAAPAVAAAPAPATIKGQNAIKQTEVRKPVKTVKHARNQARTHVRHARTYGHHHVAHLGKHLAKPGKVTKTNKTVKSPA
jgi:hypothetical protein